MITVNGCEECVHVCICKHTDCMKEAIDKIQITNVNDGLGIPDWLHVHIKCQWFKQNIRGGYICDKPIDIRNFSDC